MEWPAYAASGVTRRFSSSGVTADPKPRAHGCKDDGDEEPGLARRTDTAVVAHVANHSRGQEYDG